MVCTTDIGWRHQCFKGELLTKPAIVFTLCPNLENAASEKTLINQSRWKYDVMGKWNSYGVFRIYSKKVLMTTVSAPPLPHPTPWISVCELISDATVMLLGSERNRFCWFLSLSTDIQFQGMNTCGNLFKKKNAKSLWRHKKESLNAAGIFDNAKAFQVIWSFGLIETDDELPIPWRETIWLSVG